MRRLLVLSNSIADTFKWRTLLGLANNDIIHCSPYQRADKYRGLSTYDVALVELDPDLRLSYGRLSYELISVLERYTAMGMKHFDGREVREILTWLGKGRDIIRALDHVEQAHREWERSG